MSPEPEADRKKRRASAAGSLSIPVRGTLEVGDQRPPRTDVDALGRLVEALRDELEKVKAELADLRAETHAATDARRFKEVGSKRAEEHDKAIRTLFQKVAALEIRAKEPDFHG